MQAMMSFKTYISLTLRILATQNSAKSSVSLCYFINWIGNLAAIDGFASLYDLDAASYQKTYQDELDVNHLVNDDIFNGDKPLNLDKLFDTSENK